jgi:hypothetical protein
MEAKWTYFYEKMSFKHNEFAEKFNEHLNSRAAEGWEPTSAQYDPDEWVKAYLIWQR